MNITIDRFQFTPESTIGRMYIDGAYECYTLEDPVRDEKIAGATAIPAGRYRVTITPSPRFGRLLPILHGVPGFEGVRIHVGNTAADTAGCILVGASRGADSIGRSRLAFDQLYGKIAAAIARGEIVEITYCAAAPAPVESPKAPAAVAAKETNMNAEDAKNAFEAAVSAEAKKRGGAAAPSAGRSTSEWLALVLTTLALVAADIVGKKLGVELSPETAYSIAGVAASYITSRAAVKMSSSKAAAISNVAQ